MLTPQQRQATEGNQIEAAIYQAARQHRGCMPGVIQSIDTVGGNVTVRPSITEAVVINGVRQDVPLPDLPMVKLAVFGANGFHITLPVAAGDECLLIFQDMCIDAAWQNGGTNNPQLDKRRHDLSDAICIPLTWTKPSLLASYSTSSLQIRNTAGTTVIDIASGQITIKAGTQVQITAPAIAMGPSGGTPGALMTANFFTWFTTSLMPFLTGLGYTGPAPPGSSITTDVKGS